MDNRIKIKELKNDDTLNTPNYSLGFPQASSEDGDRKFSYKILTRLMGSGETIIDLNSSILSMPYAKRVPYVEEFVETIKGLGLDYRCSKNAPSASQSFLSTLFGNKSSSALEVLAYIPGEIWIMEGFEKILPLYGATYYFTAGKVENPQKLLDDTSMMLDKDKLSCFNIIAFDFITANSMGLYTSHHSLADIQGILGND